MQSHHTNPRQKKCMFFFYKMLLTNKCELFIKVLVVKYPIGVGGDEKKCNLYKIQLILVYFLGFGSSHPKLNKIYTFFFQCIIK
jgi:hypothetical protein